MVLSKKNIPTFKMFISLINLPGHGFSLHVSVSTLVEPSAVQSCPPCAVAGLLHSRCLLCSAPPQDTGHSSHSLNAPHPPLTGHGVSLHATVSTLVEPSTVQSCPPCAGAGLLHSRYLLCSAPPHETGHSSQSPNPPHPPFTGHGFSLHLSPM